MSRAMQSTIKNKCPFCGFSVAPTSGRKGDRMDISAHISAEHRPCERCGCVHTFITTSGTQEIIFCARCMTPKARIMRDKRRGEFDSTPKRSKWDRRPRKK